MPDERVKSIKNAVSNLKAVIEAAKVIGKEIKEEKKKEEE